MYLSVLMRRMGFRVLPAKNGVEVLKLMKISLPDLVMLDYTMPVMDGLSALRHIKNDGRLKEVPIIMVTAHSHLGGVAEFMKAGAVGYIAKPINIKELHALLQDCVTYSGGKKRGNMRTALQKNIPVSAYGLNKTYYAVTLSEKGIYLRTKEPLPVDTEVDLVLPLAAGTSLNVRGVVIYHKDAFSDSIDAGMAVEFKDLSHLESGMVSAFITQSLAGDLLREQDEDILSDRV
jgi:CheY-like chemotaxis protein